MLKSILLALALPPVCFLYCVVLGLLILRRHRSGGRALVGIGLVGLALLSIPLVPNLMIVALERGLPTMPPPDAMPQAIVILGGDLLRTEGPPHSLPVVMSAGSAVLIDCHAPADVLGLHALIVYVPT